MKWKMKSNRDILFKKLPREEKFFQRLKDFYLHKIDSLTKRILFWVFTIAFFIFTLPFWIGGILIYYLISRFEIEPLWFKFGLIFLILTVTFIFGIRWDKNLLGMNTPPVLIVSSPNTEEVKVKGVDIIEISGEIKPVGSTVKINDYKVEVAENGSFIKNISVSKGKNEIKIIGKHGSGVTEKTILVYRELTEEELTEEKKLEEERKARAEVEEKTKRKTEVERKAKEEAERKAEAERKIKKEAERKAREEAEKKTEEEARAKDEAEKEAKEKAEEEKLKFVKVTVTQLAKDFYSNSQAAGQKYGHRILEISGEVKTIGHSDEISVLEFKNTVIPVLCRFYSSRNQLAKFEQGDLITIRGEVYPQLILGVLAIEDCELIKEVYSLGESVIIDNIQFTVVKYKVTQECYDKYQSPYYGLIQAPEGAKFFWLYVKAINEDEVARKLPFEGTAIYLKYKDNRIYKSVACFIEDEYHASVDEIVYPGVSREGWILYEIPKDLDLLLVHTIVEIFELGEKKGEALWEIGS